MRFRTITQTLGPVAANGSGDFQITIPNDSLNIFRLKVVPSILGGTAQYQLFDNNSYDIADMVYGTQNISGVFNDPVGYDTDGEVIVLAKARAFILPYHDVRENQRLYVKVINRDSQTKSFDIEIECEVPMFVNI